MELPDAGRRREKRVGGREGIDKRKEKKKEKKKASKA